MKKTIKKFSLIILASITFAACSEQKTFTHHIISVEEINNAEIAYIEVNGENSKSPLAVGELIIDRVQGDVLIGIKDNNGMTIFKNIPDKYINLDADVEISRNIFKSYFPEDWAPMKGRDYTSIYIKSKQDNQVFFMMTVATGTDKEYGRYAESF